MPELEARPNRNTKEAVLGNVEEATGNASDTSEALPRDSGNAKK
jgi:hypothetical protein